MGKGGGAGDVAQRLRALAMQAGELDFPRNPVKSWYVTELPVVMVLGVGRWSTADAGWGCRVVGRRVGDGGRGWRLGVCCKVVTGLLAAILDSFSRE